MFGIEPLARIVRHDARIEVKVPAAKGKKAYSYFREGGEGEKKSSGVGKKVALVGGGLALAGLGAAAIAMSRKKTETGGVAAPVSEPKKVGNNNTARNVAIGVGAAGLGAAAARIAASKNGIETELEIREEKKVIALLPPAKEPEDKKPFAPKKKNEVINNGVIIVEGLSDYEIGRMQKVKEMVDVSSDTAREIAYSIDYYTSGDYPAIRSAEKKGQGCFIPGLGDDSIDAVKSINDFLDLAPKYEGVVFRGLGLKESMLEDYLANIQQDGLILKAMSSFSKSESVANRFAGEDKTPKKAKGSAPLNEKHIGIVLVSQDNKSGVDISRISSLPREQEVLVPAGTFYRASRIEKGSTSDWEDFYYIYVDEVDPKNQKERRKKGGT